MLTRLVMAAHAASAPAAAPALGAVSVVSVNPGVCSSGSVSQPAQLQVQWAVTNPDPTQYQTRVYENGIVKASLANTATSWTKPIAGAVEYGDASPWTSDWVYRVDIVRLSDGAQIASASSGHWRQPYGGCTKAL